MAGVVESVKAAAGVYMPVSGEVVEVNQALADEPSLAQQRPDGRRLVLQGQARQGDEIAALMDEAAYKALRLDGAGCAAPACAGYSQSSTAGRARG